jgi:hypothetical protein
VCVCLCKVDDTQHSGVRAGVRRETETLHWFLQCADEALAVCMSCWSQCGARQADTCVHARTRAGACVSVDWNRSCVVCVGGRV